MTLRISSQVQTHVLCQHVLHLSRPLARLTRYNRVESLFGHTNISIAVWTKDVMHLHFFNKFDFRFYFIFKEALIEVVAHLKHVSTSTNNNNNNNNNNNLYETITI